MDQPNGLSSQAATALLARHGPNELPRHERPAWRLLLGHLWGPIAWMIELAALLSALVRDWSDLALILVLLAANAVVGFWEEYKAGNEVAALQAQLALEARVCRDGHWLLLPARAACPPSTQLKQKRRRRQLHFNCTGAHKMGNQWMPCAKHGDGHGSGTSH